MFSFQEYIIGWSIYLVATLGVLWVFWRMTRNIPWFYFKQSLRLVVAVFFLVPAAADGVTEYWAPAWIKGILGLVFTGVDALTPVLRGLIIVALIALFVFFILELIAQLLRRLKKTRTG